MVDWTKIVLCDECGRGNPVDADECIYCAQPLVGPPEPEFDNFDMRPYIPPNMSTPFVAKRAPGEIERAKELIRKEGLFSWRPPKHKPGELTDEMIAEAENVLRVNLPASLLAILKMQNGGSPRKGLYRPDRLPLMEVSGIAPGCVTLRSLQEMPVRIWLSLEGYLDDETYQQWRESFKGQIHPDWGTLPRIPETILLLDDEDHWGIGLSYVKCGRQGEPSVVHVEMEGPNTGAEILEEIAPDFMTFMRTLYEEIDESSRFQKTPPAGAKSKKTRKWIWFISGWIMMAAAVFFSLTSLYILGAKLVWQILYQKSEETIVSITSFAITFCLAVFFFWVARRFLRSSASGSLKMTKGEKRD